MRSANKSSRKKQKGGRKHTSLKNKPGQWLERIGNKNQQFYKSDEWRSLRLKVLRKYGPVCMRCEATGADVEIHVDHIKPRSTHPELQLKFSNMQVLCKPCNIEKSNKHDTDYRGEQNIKTSDSRVSMEYTDQMLYEAHDMMEPTGEKI